MKSSLLRAGVFACLILFGATSFAEEIKHSFLGCGKANKTVIVSEDGKIEWKMDLPTSDGWVLPNGNVRCIYDEAVNLACIGSLHISRGSHVEPNDQGRWLADLSPVNGPVLGPFDNRSQALVAERCWLESNWLNPQPVN